MTKMRLGAHYRFSLKAVMGYILVAGAAFAVGNGWGQRAMLERLNIELNGVQTSLALNRLLDDRHWKELLEKGCIEQATKALDTAEDKDLELLSALFKKPLDSAAIKYVSDRDPKLIEQLKTFRSKYGQQWPEEECKP